jgi:hypothetical protein
MKARGKVLRPASSHPGLLMIAGRQYWFSAEMWCAAGGPVSGSEVEAELDDAMQVLEIVTVDDARADRESAAQVKRERQRRLRWAVLTALSAVMLLSAWALISLEF